MSPEITLIIGAGIVILAIAVAIIIAEDIMKPHHIDLEYRKPRSLKRKDDDEITKQDD